MRSLRIILAVFSVVIFYSCKKTVDPYSEFTKISDFSSTTITCEGISSGDKILERGFCWNTNGSPTIFDNKVVSGSDDGSYTATIENLGHGVEYHVRAYCANRLKISYSDEKVVRTVSDPTLSVYFPSVITNTSFAFGGFISSPYALTEAGICYDLNPNPTVSNFTTSIPVAPGLFTTSVAGLTPNTIYYYRAFAKLGPTIFYSENQAMVKTYYSTVTDVDGNMYYTILIGSQEWMAENLRVEHFQTGAPIYYRSKMDWDTTSINWGIYGNYNDDASFKSIYGHLYDGYAITNFLSLAPAGWRVSSIADWGILENYLGGDTSAAGKMIKENFYGFPDGLYTNSSGFSAIMGGQRPCNALDFGQTGSPLSTTFWTDGVDFTLYSGSHRRLTYGSNAVQTGTTYVWGGNYVRCVKN